MVVLIWRNGWRSRRVRVRVRLLGMGLALTTSLGTFGCGRSEPPVAAVTQPGARRSEMADFMKTHPPARPGRPSR